ncbi:alternative ribosome rescue aminoacyl-tRNA hydrolase ArfB [Nocardiopsis changdeensis]|uniref:Aminoacyl-tRNA hydrolase n=1 Tax=Nocardiopsis changdeensis TaxID=2831969 RepID=A0ABX8BG57_9ACTN|nr:MULTISPECIES: alternative ribosome rescue aminoacyl-tRNA hydrolase ArfB [Nocardiopsis]QUX21210.1 aminoacyl-tRNA hydrolase [Nocardiopsis changdeensis]QYX37140.1 aminoacyl-tRNA hydrolase [Nocardiopsis sp. MT53]
MNTGAAGDGGLVVGPVTVPADALAWRFSRSSGPGGQHVNTSDTRVSLSLDVAGCAALGRTRRERALERLAGRLVDGVLTVSVQTHRSQARNRAEARERMAALLAEAIAPPPRERRATRPGRAARQRRLDAKKRRGDIKRSRSRPTSD